jgi:spore germination protein GerM
MARKRNTIGCLFYVALVLLVLVVFLFNRAKVQQVIEKTGFARLFERKQRAPVEVVVKPPDEAPGAAPGGQAEPTGAAEPAPAGTPSPKQKPLTEVVVELVQPPPRQPAPSQAPESPATRTRKARLFFIAIKANGGIELKSVIRPIQYTDAPLTSTLQALLAGPTPVEVNQGLISLIAPEARLRKAQVKDGIAYLDFSEAFRFNSLGQEGLSAQLQQVVYSATEFPTVKQVQILLEGRTADYLSPEGLFIGKPLSRESFRR